MATTVIVLSDVILSNDVIEMGVEGSNDRYNTRVQLENGNQNVNQVWDDTMRHYTFGVVPMGLEAWAEIEALQEVTEGGTYGFLMEDPKDHYVSVGVMVQLSAGVYQLYKRIVHAGSGRYKDRKITRPRLAGFAATASGVPVVSFTLNQTNGQITIPAAPAAATLAWTGPFYVPVHFEKNSIDWSFMAGGNDDQRLLAGPAVLAQEILE